MKKILTALLSLSLLVGLCACNAKTDDNTNSNETVEPTTKGQALVALFNSIDTTKPLEEIAQEISTKQETGITLDLVTPVQPGWLNGFNEDVTNFTEGYEIGAMMSQPYVAYVFKSDDLTALKEELDSKYNLRWNICTEADEYITAEKDGVLFCAMVLNAEDY